MSNVAQLVPVAEITVDNPDCDGLITAHGFAYNWEFKDRPDGPAAPVWEHHNTEVLRGMNAVSPRSQFRWIDMLLANWQVEDGVGYWQEQRLMACKPQAKFLHFKDASIGSYGSIITKVAYRPSVFLRLFRWRPAIGETDSPLVEIQLLGNGSGYEYGLILPWPTDDEADYNYKYPTLFRREAGETGGGTRLAEYQGLGGMRSLEGSEASYQNVMIEQIGDWIRIELSGTGEPWLFETGDAGLSIGFVRVIFYRHPGMFTLQALKFPATSYCEPREYLKLPAWINSANTTYGSKVYEAPAGTSLSVTEQVDPTDARASKPRLTFTNSDRWVRPVCYLLQQGDPGAIGSARSSEVSTAGTGRLLEVGWSRNARYRGAQFTARLRDPSAYAWKGNEKATLALDWDAGTGATVVNKVTGYIVPQKPLAAGRAMPDQRELRVTVRDGVEARLSKKFMLYMPSFEKWTAAEVFEYVLNRSGVPDALIDVDSAVDERYTLPWGDPKWERSWNYAPDYGVVAALDEMLVKLFGLQWGNDADGKYFLREEPQWTTGDTPDFTLDWDTTTDDDVITMLEPERAGADFRNYVAAIVGLENRESGWLARDEGSHRTPTDNRFVGDDWWEVVNAEDHQQATQISNKRLAEFLRSKETLTWTTRREDLGPDKFVAVQAASVIDLPDDSVCRIVTEEGQAAFDSGPPDMTATYTMVVEEYGS